MEDYWGIKKMNSLLKGRCSDKIRILSKLCNLSEVQTRILYYTFCSHLYNYEIAYKLNLSERSVRYRKKEALLAIQDFYEEYGADNIFEVAKLYGLKERDYLWRP